MPAFQSPVATQPLSNILFQQPACPAARSADLRRGPRRSAATLVEHIRYKVIIRIRLSVPRLRYMLVSGRVCCPSSIEGSEICPGRRQLSWKCASAWRSPATCRPNSDRVGDVRLQRWRLPACVSRVMWPAVDFLNGKAAVLVTDRAARPASLTKMSIWLDRQRPSARLSRARRLICFSETWRRRPFNARAALRSDTIVCWPRTRA
jgi:hypothetical protein